jgi:hypothetical protein
LTNYGIIINLNPSANGGVVAGSANNILITNTFFDTHATTGMYFDATSNANSIFLIQCVNVNAQSAGKSLGTNICNNLVLKGVNESSFVGCQFNNSTGIGVYVAGSSSSIVFNACMFIGNGNLSGAAGAELDNTANRITFTACNFGSGTSSVQTYAVIVAASTVAACSILGGTFETTTTNGVTTNGTGLYVKNVAGFTPKGNLSSYVIPTPAFPASGVSQTNFTPFDVEVYVASSGGITNFTITYANGTSTGALGVASNRCQFTLAPGDSVVFTWTSPSPAWVWVGK